MKISLSTDALYQNSNPLRYSNHLTNDFQKQMKHSKMSILGMGKKNHFPPFVLTKATQYPAPNTYQPQLIKSNSCKVNFKKNHKHKFDARQNLQFMPTKQLTFRLNASQSQRNFTQENYQNKAQYKFLFFRQQEPSPGPGTYYSNKDCGYGKQMASFKLKLKALEQNQFYIPPDRYNPIYSQVSQQAKLISFGTSKKWDIRCMNNNKTDNQNPGPGAYDVSTYTFRNKSKNYKLNYKHLI